MKKTNNDYVSPDEEEEHGPSSYPSNNPIIGASDDNLPRPARSPARPTREATRHSPYPTARSSSRGRSTITRRTHVRRVKFEVQIDGRF